MFAWGTEFTPGARTCAKPAGEFPRQNLTVDGITSAPRRKNGLCANGYGVPT